ncbi:hypothetical protein [Microvirga zambiensis]|uniref:hypothetical protein n=1 Tax=Microvirga zambiensis TaxID=1402137 RepID=UPI00191FF8FA|nr:hypothetical protein [Microvirga zambiensis]
MIEATDTIEGAITKLAAGNLGAASVLGRIVDDPFSGLLVLLDLDRIGLNGEQIWRLYRDVYDTNLDRFVGHVKIQVGRIDGPILRECP